MSFSTPLNLTFFALMAQSLAEVAYVPPDFNFPGPLIPGKVEFENRPLPIPLISWAADAATIEAHGGTLANRRSDLARAMDTKVELELVDDFDQQIVDYVNGHTPFLRGSIGQMLMAAEALETFGADLQPVVFLLLSWSNGADGLVTNRANNLTGLPGNTIAIQAKGRHLDLLSEILARGQFSPDELKLVHLPESTFHAAAAMDGRCHDPINALANDQSLGAAFGLRRDFTKANLTPLFTTQEAPRILADVYAVRADFLESHGELVRGFAQAQSEEQERFASKLQSGGFESVSRTMAGVFLNEEDLHADFSDWVQHVDFPGTNGNRDFFSSSDSSGFTERSRTIRDGLISVGQLQKRIELRHVSLSSSDPG